jgi:hypothetical protein
MAATIRITCTHSAPKGWEWANHINKGFRHPTALIGGEEKQLAWDGPSDIPVAAAQPHQVAGVLQAVRITLVSSRRGDSAA